MKWGGVEINTSRIKNSDGSTIESRFQTVESAGGGGGSESGIHGFLAPNGMGVTGMLTNLSTGNLVPMSDTMYTYPLIMARNYTFNSIKIYCTTPLSGALCRVLIYSDLNSAPDSKIYESRDIDLSTAGIKTTLTTMTLDKGVIYWMVIHFGLAGSPLQIRSINNLTALVQGYRDNNSPYSLISSTATLGNAPSPAGAFNPSTSNMPLIALFQ